MDRPSDQLGNENRFIGLQFLISEWYRTQAGFGPIVATALELCPDSETLTIRVCDELGVSKGTVLRWASGKSIPHEIDQQHIIEFIFETAISL